MADKVHVESPDTVNKYVNDFVIVFMMTLKITHL